MSDRNACARGGRAALGLVLALLGAGAARAQTPRPVVDVRPAAPAVPAWVEVQIQDPDDPKVREYAARQKRKVQMERELRKLRQTHFGDMRNVAIRQAGIDKLRSYTDPAIFPSLLEIFQREKDDVRHAILDHLASLRTDEADTTLCWAAVFDRNPAIREGAAAQVVRRARESGGPSERIRTVIAEGFRRNRDAEVIAAARLAQSLRLAEAIPALINAQVQQVAQIGGGYDDSSLGYIMVGTQQAFVSDLTPVVGDSAVAFDPTVAVVTEGVYLRVLDAVVVTYRVEVNNALIGLSSDLWGRPTNRLGWDQEAWREWYTKEFKPYWAAEEARRTAEAPAPPK